jgi:MFS family permease
MQTEKLLEKVGDQHRYQIYSIVFVCTKWLVISLTIFLPSYLLITPTFTCGSQLAVKEVDACPIIATCTIDQPFTITNHANLYCNELFTRQSILSAEFVGSVTGLILLSVLADKLGRRRIIISTLVISLVGTVRKSRSSQC